MAKKLDAKTQASPIEAQSYWPEEDARTLQRAQEIQSDKGRHKAAQTHAKKQIDSLSKIAAPKPTAAKKVPTVKSKKK